MIRRIFVEKKEGNNVASKKALGDFRSVLNLEVDDVKIIIRYDIENIDETVYEKAKNTIFSEAPVDELYEEDLPAFDGYNYVVVEYLPGQYDQRADSAMQCVQLLSMGNKPLIRCATVYAVKCDASYMPQIKHYLINPVESREGLMEKPETLVQEINAVEKVKKLDEFVKMSEDELFVYHERIGFAMSKEDLKFVQSYFSDERRAPTETELKVIDTYWSDHCRHTTFNTEITKITIDSDNPHLKQALEEYERLYNEFNSKRSDKYKCLMDIATIAVKKLKSQGLLDNLDTSDEINACSVVVNVDVDGKDEEWLIMFKNETHNHPTEIEPFGGAATCLGGAIRDPLSGRTYVYQAMRVTGSADPREKLSDTLKGKLPQRVITKTAASGYSSYGNQIGLSTGLVAEMYHENYKAKRLETGYVIAGAPRENVKREKPQKGDIIVLLGGDTGRDGCGGATGSSKAHTEKSVEVCGAEVQKGNPLTERKIQRLFRIKEVAQMIIKCNDFGAGGVSVAIGELADSLDIYLDKVPKKYEGLSGTELAISESQERMACVIKPHDLDKFIKYAESENLKATVVAEVTDNGRMRMTYQGDTIVDLKREFLDTNGVKQRQEAVVKDRVSKYIEDIDKGVKEYLDAKDIKGAVLHNMSRLNVCSTKGLGEIFDGTIGAASVIMPFGGKYQLTPSIVMAAKPPVKGYTDTATVSTYACSPQLMSSSPFTGAVYSVLTSVAKLIASGVKLSTIRLTLQEFFKKLGKDEERWGEPLGALLGALYAQVNIGVGAIGGKDSMSGSFEKIDVPPTLISFAMGITKASKMITNTVSERSGDKVYRISVRRDDNNIPDFNYFVSLAHAMHKEIENGNIKACSVVEEGGLIAALLKSFVGNKVGFTFDRFDNEFFAPKFGDFVFVADNVDGFGGFDVDYIGYLNGTHTVEIGDVKIKMDEIIESFTKPLENVFPSKAPASGEVGNLNCFALKKERTSLGIAKPRVLIPVFPGTNCEYDTARAFERAGAKAEIFVVKNQKPHDIEEDVRELKRLIDESQIIAFPGGFSGGDEPDGSGKFIATTFKNPIVADAVMNMLYKRDGLAIGICNGFQALIKLGLVPYGDIREQSSKAPTLTFNNISRHVSTIVKVRVATNKTPWFNDIKVNEIFNVPVSHGEGRFVSSKEELDKIIKNGQVATQYVDMLGNATMESPYNPNGSMYAIEGIISPDGRVLGKMGHAERIDDDLYKNVEGNYDMRLFASGVKYFK